MASAQELLQRLALVIASEARNILRGRIKSKTLARAMEVATQNVPGLGIGLVTFPHYWARYYHDGRGPVTARPGHYLVFFKNPDDDPRIAGGYPVKLTDVRRLTKAEFQRFLKEDRIIVTKEVGPMRGQKFLRGLKALAGRVHKIVARRLTEHVEQELKDLFNIRGTIRL